MEPTSGMYSGNVNGCYVGTTDTKYEQGVPFMDLKIDVTHQWNGSAWDACAFRATVRLWFNDKGEKKAFETLQMLQWDGNFDNPQFGQTQLPLTCWKNNGDKYYRWGVNLGGSDGEKSTGKVAPTTAARIAGRFANFSNNGHAANAASAPAAVPAPAAVAPQPAPVAPQPPVAAAAPAPASFNQPTSPAPVPSTPPAPEALPGQGDDDIPF